MRTQKYKELSKNTLLFSLSSFGSKLISFLLVPLYTYTLATADYGVVDLLNTTISLLIPLLTFNVQDAVLRFTLDKDQSPKDVISISFKVIVISSAFLSVAVLLISRFGVVKLDWYYWVFLVAGFGLNALLNSLSMYLRSIDKVATIVISGIISTTLMCGLNIFFLLVLRMGVLGYLISQILALFMSCLFCVIHGAVYKNISFKISKSLQKDMLIYSAPLIINSIAWWLNEASDRYIVTIFCGTAVNGVYSVSYKIPLILSTIQSIFYKAWSVSAIKEFDSDDADGFLGNIYSVVSCLSIVSCSALQIINPILSKVLFAKEYYEAWKYVPPLLAGIVFYGLGLFEGSLFTAVKNTKLVSVTTLIAAVLNTTLNFILIPIYGAYGAAFATMVGYISIWLMRTIFLRNIVSLKVFWPGHIACYLIIVVQGLLASRQDTLIVQGILFLLLLCFTLFSLFKAVKSNFFSKKSQGSYEKDL